MVTRSGNGGREVGAVDDTRGRPLLAEETWSRVGEIIETALSIPDAAARAAFVDTSCASDRALLAEVRSLLAADTHADFVLPATRWLDATTLARDAVKEMRHSEEAGGLSGAPVLQASNRVIRQLRAALGKKYPIIGVGGIMSAEDAVSKIRAGANVVQIYTGLIYRGPDLVREAALAIKAAG